MQLPRGLFAFSAIADKTMRRHVYVKIRENILMR